MPLPAAAARGCGGNALLRAGSGGGAGPRRAGAALVRGGGRLAMGAFDGNGGR